MESNLDTKNIVKSNAPKLNVKTISTSVFGSKGDANGEIESLKESVRKIHGTISQLASHVRSALNQIKALETRVGNVEEKLIVNTEKTFEIEKNVISNVEKTFEIEKNVISNVEKTFEIEKNITTKTVEIEKNIILNTEKIVEIDKKLKPESGLLGNDANKTLVETNKVLIGVQKELSDYFSSQAKFQKEERTENLKEESKKKLKAEESLLKKSSKKLGSAIAGAANAIVTPAKGIFDSIMEFVTIMAAGIPSNAIFEWLKDEENRKKIEGWFDWIKEHWKWGLAALGGLLLIPLVSAITGVITVISSLAGVIASLMGPLIGLMFNPLFWKIALAVGAGVLVWKAGEWVVNKIKDHQHGGGTFTMAEDHLNQVLASNNMKVEGGRTRSTEIERMEQVGGTPGMYGGAGGGVLKPIYKQLTPQQKEIANKVQTKKVKLDALRDKFRKELDVLKDKKREEFLATHGQTKEYLNTHPQDRPAKIAEYLAPFEAKLREQYDPLITNILNEGNVITQQQQRIKGGPVSQNQTYLVGEGGPELFVPNINGTIINNQRTEKIYRMITSKKRGRGGVNIQTLPMQTHEIPPAEVNIPSSSNPTNVYVYSSINKTDPYRMSMTEKLLGIKV